MTSKVLFPIGVIVLTISLVAVVFGFIIPMSESYHFTQWQELSIEGQRDVLQTRYDEAEKCFRQALAEVRQSGAHRREEAETLILFGDLLRRKEKYAEAETNFDAATKILEAEIAVEKNAEETTNLRVQLSNALSRLAMTLDVQGKSTEANRLRERVLEIYKNISSSRTIPGDSVLLSEQMVRNYGKLAEQALNAGKYPEAREFYMKSLEIGLHHYVPEEIWLPLRSDCIRLVKTAPTEDDPIPALLEREQVTPFTSSLDK